MEISNIIFTVLLLAGTILFIIKIREIIFNIRLGQELTITDNKKERFNTMLRVAFGQTKMMARPLVGLLHFFVYAGFIIINIEVLEIIIDGIAGTHRVLSFMGPFYNFLIASFEILALLVLVGVIVFMVRRAILRIPRFHYREMTTWPKTDAMIILMTEVLLMCAFLTMNATDSILQDRNVHHYIDAGSFPVSSFIKPWFENMSNEALINIERGTWWFHIIGIIAFLNYLPYSKHLHIVLAFPNTYYSNLNPKGQFTNNPQVTNEVKLMMDPSAQAPVAEGPPKRFGAKDVTDLTWKNLMDAYSCTECGRCSSACPATQTGKLLSPRKIMMDTRDRMEELGKNKKKHGKDHDDGKSLLGHYILEEELWACNTCNACVQECPVNIDPLNIIMEMRRYLVMEESKNPSELSGMMTNIENNGAPWQFSPSDRLNWKDEV
ncbi:MAG TPA: (Fe-S)-binding protein [Flavobacteriales bacterium]|nr:(Fe-S)-binding protein [Flavobacteriales bacterium]